VDNYPFYIPQVYGWCYLTSTDTDTQIAGIWQADSGETSATSGYWNFYTSSGGIQASCAGFIYPALGAWGSAKTNYLVYAADSLASPNGCPGILFYRFCYVTQTGADNTYSTTQCPNPLITKAGGQITAY
jgi:hypothetical protein